MLPHLHRFNRHQRHRGHGPLGRTLLSAEGLPARGYRGDSQVSRGRSRRRSTRADRERDGGTGEAYQGIAIISHATKPLSSLSVAARDSWCEQFLCCIECSYKHRALNSYTRLSISSRDCRRRRGKRRVFQVSFSTVCAHKPCSSRVCFQFVWWYSQDNWSCICGYFKAYLGICIPSIGSLPQTKFPSWIMFLHTKCLIFSIHH